MEEICCNFRVQCSGATYNSAQGLLLAVLLRGRVHAGDLTEIKQESLSVPFPLKYRLIEQAWKHAVCQGKDYNIFRKD